MLASELLEVLVCPQSHQPMIYFPRGESNRDEGAAFLLCPASRLRYRVDAGVPVLLVDEAQILEPDQVATLVATAQKLGLPVPA